MTAQPGHDGGAGIAGLLSDVASALARVLRGELALARAETADGLRGALGGAAQLAAGVVAGLVGLILLAGAAVAALVAAGLGPIWSPLLVGATLLIIAFGLVQAGQARLRPDRILPRRALRGLARDAETVGSPFSKGTTHV